MSAAYYRRKFVVTLDSELLFRINILGSPVAVRHPHQIGTKSPCALYLLWSMHASAINLDVFNPSFVKWQTTNVLQCESAPAA